MPTGDAVTINGLRFRLVFFDFIYMLGELLTALSELHVKVQLVDRYCNKLLHNLRLLEKQKASEEEMREFVRRENRELLTGLERQNIFYDKYRLKLLHIHHAGTEGGLLVEDTYGGSQYVVPVKRVVSVLLTHVFDSTPVREMALFRKEAAVLRLSSAWDTKPGETEQKAILELNEAAGNVHVYVKKEKLANVGYLASGTPVNDAQLIAAAEAQETDKDRFLKDPLVSALFPRVEAVAL